MKLTCSLVIAAIWPISTSRTAPQAIRGELFEVENDESERVSHPVAFSPPEGALVASLPSKILQRSQLPEGWTEHLSQEPGSRTGRTYYYNAASGESTWNRPYRPPLIPADAVDKWRADGKEKTRIAREHSEVDSEEDLDSVKLILMESVASKLHELEAQLPDLTEEDLEKLPSILQTFSAKALSRHVEKSSSPKGVCCCSERRCFPDERGERGDRAQEVKEGLCCKYMQIRFPEWKQTDTKVCKSFKQKEIQRMLMTAQAASNSTQEECRSQLQSALDFFKRKIQTGMWISADHKARIAEEALYELFIIGSPMQETSIGRSLFQVRQSVKLLWTGLLRDVREAWKKYWEAGELSRGKDTDFALVVEHPDVGQLTKCRFEGQIPIFWEAASASFANLDAEKTLKIIVGKDEAALMSTAFWNAELPALAKSPPIGQIEFVAILDAPKCVDLMRLVRKRIEAILEGTRASKSRWEARRAFFECRDLTLHCLSDPQSSCSKMNELDRHAASRGLPVKYATWQLGQYPSPGWTPKQLLENLKFTLKQLKDAGFTVSQLIDIGPPLVTAPALMDGGFTRDELLAAGYSKEHVGPPEVPFALLHAGYTRDQLLAAAKMKSA